MQAKHPYISNTRIPGGKRVNYKMISKTLKSVDYFLAMSSLHTSIHIIHIKPHVSHAFIDEEMKALRVK